MDDATFIRSIKPLSDLLGIIHGTRKVHGLPGKHVFPQRFTINVIHHNIVKGLIFAIVEDAYNMRITQLLEVTIQGY